MTIEAIKKKLQTEEYDFLRKDKNLGNQMMILTLGGSHAYGTDKEGSDLDVRGIAANTKQDILLGTDFEQVVDVDTDTTIYSFQKMISLLASNNPNTMEILGCKEDIISIYRMLAGNSWQIEKCSCQKYVFIHLGAMLAVSFEEWKIKLRDW